MPARLSHSLSLCLQFVSRSLSRIEALIELAPGAGQGGQKERERELPNDSRTVNWINADMQIKEERREGRMRWDETQSKKRKHEGIVNVM